MHGFVSVMKLQSQDMQMSLKNHLGTEVKRLLSSAETFLKSSKYLISFVLPSFSHSLLLVYALSIVIALSLQVTEGECSITTRELMSLYGVKTHLTFFLFIIFKLFSFSYYLII